MEGSYAAVLPSSFAFSMKLGFLKMFISLHMDPSEIFDKLIIKECSQGYCFQFKKIIIFFLYHLCVKKRMNNDIYCLEVYTKTEESVYKKAGTGEVSWKVM